MFFFCFLRDGDVEFKKGFGFRKLFVIWGFEVSGV